MFMFFSNLWLFRYECGLARLFEDPYTSRLYTERTIQCNWNGTWTPVDYLNQCVWIACLNPPMVNKDELRKNDLVDIKNKSLYIFIISYLYLATTIYSTGDDMGWFSCYF